MRYPELLFCCKENGGGGGEGGRERKMRQGGEGTERVQENRERCTEEQKADSRQVLSYREIK